MSLYEHVQTSAAAVIGKEEEDEEAKTKTKKISTKKISMTGRVLMYNF